MKVTTDGCLFGAWVAEEVYTFTRSHVHMLDIGTGTGLLSLMIAQKNDVLIDAIEIDKEAAEQAKENVAASPWKEKINIINKDVLQWKTEKKFEVIVSNPPFYEKEIRSEKKLKNIAHHDEGLKLAALFEFVKNHLTENGFFFLLLPAKRQTELEALLKCHGLYLQKMIFARQSFSHQPFRLMIKGSHQKTDDIPVKEITVKNNQQQYTPEAISLLKDYYLYL